MAIGRRTLSFLPEIDVLDPSILDYAQHATSSYAFMLREDVENSIIPYRSETFNVELVPDDQQMTEIVTAALDHQGQATWALQEAVTSFVRECTQTIMAYSEALCEIARSESANADSSDAFSLVEIPPGSIRFNGLTALQRLPLDLRDHGFESGSIWVPFESVVVFRFPQQYQQELPRILKRLASLGRHHHPEWAIQEAMSASGTAFDFDEFAYREKLELASCTKSIGWNARFMLMDVATENYLLERQLRFEEFVIRLRNRIIGTLNLALANATSRMGRKCEIKVSGLPGLDDVSKARSRLERGEGSISSIFAQFQLGA